MGETFECDSGLAYVCQLAAVTAAGKAAAAAVAPTPRTDGLSTGRNAVHRGRRASVTSLTHSDLGMRPRSRRR